MQATHSSQITGWILVALIVGFLVGDTSADQLSGSDVPSELRQLVSSIADLIQKVGLVLALWCRQRKSKARKEQQPRQSRQQPVLQPATGTVRRFACPAPASLDNLRKIPGLMSKG